jgi:hypothetical protein
MGSPKFLHEPRGLEEANGYAPIYSTRAGRWFANALMIVLVALVLWTDPASRSYTSVIWMVAFAIMAAALAQIAAGLKSSTIADSQQLESPAVVRPISPQARTSPLWDRDLDA